MTRASTMNAYWLLVGFWRNRPNRIVPIYPR
jgi:hypothetical protein